MRKYVIALITIIALSSFAVKNYCKEFSLVGKWENTDANNPNTGFIFDADGYVFLYKDAMKRGGENFDINGVKGNMKYVFNKKANPIKLDIIITIKNKKIETKKMLMLAKIINESTISLASNDSGEIRPTEFTKKNTITFKRVQ